MRDMDVMRGDLFGRSADCRKVVESSKMLYVVGIGDGIAVNGNRCGFEG